MAFDGNGNFNQATTPVVSGTVISSTNYNTQNTDFSTGLTNVICKDGQTTPTANLKMGGFRHTNVGNGTARNDYAALGQVQDGAGIWCGTAGGTANALTLTPTPAITAYAAGQVFRFTAGASPNSGATTVAVSGLTATAVQANGAALTGGEIAANRQYSVLYDGVAFQLQAFAPSIPAADSITTAMLQNDAVTNVKLANMAANTVKVRAAATTGDPSDLALSASQLLGRGSTGDVAAIALGTGLSMSGATINSSSPFSASYESSPQTITAAGTLTLTHGLGGRPRFVQLLLRCVTAQHNWSPGDDVFVNLGQERLTSIQGIAVGMQNTTDIYIRYSNSGVGVFSIGDRLTGNTVDITPANWNLIVRAWR
ncbi:MAG: hypothetical protein INF12_14580 [Methylobacterium sp.]|nr:hypothetical protein [Methylobacterium sp.]